MVTALKAPAFAPVVDSLSIRLTGGELSKAMQVLAKVADRKSSIPMLAHVRLTVTGTGIVQLAATDLNLSAVVTCNAPIGDYTPGTACVPAKQLADILKSAPADLVALTKSGASGITVASGGSEVTMIARPVADFPKLPDAFADDLRWERTDPSVLADMIECVKASICQDETRFHLAGVLIECDGTTTRMVTTDGHRLTRKDATLAGPRIAGAIVPQKSAALIASLCKGQREAQWAVSKTHLYLHVGMWTVMAKLIDAKFPAYDQVIPKDNSKVATVERKPLIAALKRATKVASKTRGTKLAFASGKLVITADDGNGSTVSESLRAESHWLDLGNEGAFGINPAYLLDAISEMDDRHVTLEWGEDLAPILVRDTTTATEYTVSTSPHLVVIMPMRM